MTRVEILAEFLKLYSANSADYADEARECGCADPEDYIMNRYENVVDEAIKAGIIVADFENNGWHEGWARMQTQLFAIATAETR